MSRAAQLDCQHERSCALVLTLFLFQKGQGFFPPLPIAALLPRSWRRAGLPLAGEMISVAWLLCRAKNKAFYFPAVGGGHTQPLQGFCFRHSGCGAVLPLAGWDGFLMVGRFWKAIGQRVWGREP